MSIPIISVCSHPEHAYKLINSASKNGWELHLLEVEWKGFGTKLIATHEYLKLHPEIDRFIFADAFDVLVFGTEHEFEKKRTPGQTFVCSAEKGCWPNPKLESFYRKKEHGFSYLNSGLFYATKKAFEWYMGTNPPDYYTDDQEWLTDRFLNNSDIQLDTEQVLFNSHSFIAEGEYTYNNGRVQILGNEPIFVHSNGKTLDPKLDELI
jgi:hypothetical protein